MNEGWVVLKVENGFDQYYDEVFVNYEDACEKAKMLAYRDCGMVHTNRYGEALFVFHEGGSQFVMEFVQESVLGFQPEPHYGVFKLSRGAPRLIRSYKVQRMEVKEGE